MTLIDKSGERGWCPTHKLHVGKRCPGCRAARRTKSIGPVTMRTLRQSGRLAEIERWNEEALRRRQATA